MSKRKHMTYFAFGSNMFTHRMQQRVPSAEVLCVGRLDDHCLTFHKRGADYTGKCSVEESEGDAVWGVLYRIKRDELHKLDRCEGADYDRVDQYVVTPEGRKRVALYIAKPRATIEAMPAEWYRDIVLAGAKEHGLPEEYVEQLASMDAYADRRSRG